MRPTRFLARALALVSLVVSVSACAPDKVTLRLNPALGAVYEVITSVDTTTQQTVMGAETKATQQMRTIQEMVFEQGAAEGAYKVVTTFTAAHIEMLGDDGKPLNMPEVGGASPLEAASEAFIGHGFTMEMSPAGQVTSVSGMDEMMERMFEAMEVPDTVKAMMKDGMKQQFGDAAMEKMMSQAFVALPPEPVAVGESWPVDWSAMGIFMTSELTLESVEGGVATISAVVTMAPDPDHNPAPGAFSVRYDELDGEQVGSYRLDVETGMLIDADMTQEMTATMRVDIPGLPAEMAVKMPPIQDFRF